jgi:trans-aconitate 2-methyltransferase
MPWDPDTYLAYADERALPFHHLVAAVAHLRPLRVLDIGCGPGALTATLLERWPDARIVGIDSSAEMIDLANRRAVAPRLCFELADIATWSTETRFDLVLSNACFQWIEDQSRLLDDLLALMADGAALAFQVPANHDRPSHTILAELCASERWRDRLGGAFRVHVRDPEWYVGQLEARRLQPTVWRTTYLHRLEGEDPVLEWVKGTTLRPVLARLEATETADFLAEYSSHLRAAYPQQHGLTTFPFTRTFVIARTSGGF